MLVKTISITFKRTNCWQVYAERDHSQKLVSCLDLNNKHKKMMNFELFDYLFSQESKITKSGSKITEFISK